MCVLVVTMPELRAQSIVEKEKVTRGIGFINSDGKRIRIERIIEEAKTYQILTISDLLVVWSMMEPQNDPYTKARGMSVMRYYIKKEKGIDLHFSAIDKGQFENFPYDLKLFKKSVLKTLSDK